MVDAFHNNRHHIVAFAAKGLLMDNAVQSNGLLHIFPFKSSLNKCHQSIFPSCHWCSVGCYSSKPLPWQYGILSSTTQLAEYLLSGGLTMHWNHCEQLLDYFMRAVQCQCCLVMHRSWFFMADSMPIFLFKQTVRFRFFSFKQPTRKNERF